MSEVNVNPEELIEEVGYTVEDADVIPIPIDPTLSHEGEAADAKATGDAIRGMGRNMNINGVTADTEGTFHVYPENIPMSDAEEAQTLDEVLSDIGGRTGSDILLNGESTKTIEQAYEEAGEQIDEQFAAVGQRVTVVDQKIDSYILSNNAAVQNLQTQIDTEYTDEQVHQMVQDVFGGGD